MNAAIANAVVSAHGLRKAYKNKLALNDTSFQIEAGKIIGLIGPNGAGKTTALVGALESDAAEVAGDDGNPQARQHKRRARASLAMPYFSFGQSLRPRS